MPRRSLVVALAAVAAYVVTWTAPAAHATHSCDESVEVLCMIPHQICLPKPC